MYRLKRKHTHIALLPHQSTSEPVYFPPPLATSISFRPEQQIATHFLFEQSVTAFFITGWILLSIALLFFFFRGLYWIRRGTFPSWKCPKTFICRNHQTKLLPTSRFLAFQMTFFPRVLHYTAIYIIRLDSSPPPFFLSFCALQSLPRGIFD